MLNPDKDKDAPPAATTRAPPPGLIIRAREPSDWQEIAALLQLPRVRWGTLRLPSTSADETRKWLEKTSEGQAATVAVLDGRLEGKPPTSSAARGGATTAAGTGSWSTTTSMDAASALPCSAR